MLRAIFRQRRRILFTGFFLTLAVYVMLGADLYQLAASKLSPTTATLVTALTFAAFGVLQMAVLALLILIFPNLRFNAEILALTLFGSAMLMLATPTAVVDAVPMYNFWLIMVLAFGLPHLLYGAKLDRFALRLRADSSRSFVSPKSAEALWAEMVPGAGPVEQHWETALREVTPVDGNPDHLRLVYALGGGAFLYRSVKFRARNAPHHCIYRSSGEVTARNQATNAATVAITLADAGQGRTRVTVSRRPDAMLPRLALQTWMDDMTGDMLDHIRAKHLGHCDFTRTGDLMRQIEKLA